MIRGELITDERGEPVAGQWEPIITPDQWRAIHALCTNRRGKLVGQHGTALEAAVQRVAMPDFDCWHQVICSAGGCEQPVKLRGERITLDGETGELIES